MRLENRAVKKWRNLLFRGAAGALVGAVVLMGCAGKKAEPDPASSAAPPVAPYDREKSIESFEVVWNTVNEKHWDPNHGGVDWNAVHEEFRPKIEAATSSAQARDIMEEMLGRLGQSHFGIWPREVYLKDEAAASPTTTKDGDGKAGDGTAQGASGESAPKEIVTKPGKDNGVSGMEVRAKGTEAIITRVRPGSPADLAGIKPGFLLLSAKGQKLERLAKRLEKEDRPHMSKDTLMSMLLQHLIVGDVGETIEVEVEDGAGMVLKKELTLAETTGTAATLGNMPTFYMTIDSRLLPENVAYFTFSIFMDPPRLMAAYQKSVAEAQGADGFIIDIRGNPGGIGALAMGMGGWLVDEENIKLGTMTTRSGTFNFILNPRARAYMGPVAILIDGMSGSTSEIFAGGMKDVGRARIFGERSAGAALPSVFDELPNGDRFQYAIANYVSAGGRPLEGEGVTPDEEVAPDRASLLAGRDPVIEAAIRWIKGEKAKKDAANKAGGGTN